jgi:Zn-finger nucleic acid-binding protein
MLRHDSACPFCRAEIRMAIKRIDGTDALYCPSCKFVEDVATDLQIQGGLR